VASTVILGAFDGLSFEAFVATRLVPNPRSGACVVMDNCSIHKGEEIWRLIEAAGARLVYLPPLSGAENFFESHVSRQESFMHRSFRSFLHHQDLPPYSPDLSPIENFWSKIGSILKILGARSYQALEGV
jgi:transposase